MRHLDFRGFLVFLAAGCGSEPAGSTLEMSPMPEVRSLEHVLSVTEVFARTPEELQRGASYEGAEKIAFVGCSTVSARLSSGALVGFNLSMFDGENGHVMSAWRLPFSRHTNIDLGESDVSFTELERCRLSGCGVDPTQSERGWLFGIRRAYQQRAPRPAVSAGCRPLIELSHPDKKKKKTKDGPTIPLLLEGDLVVTNRREGGLEWRGVVRDEKGRPTEVWTEAPEPEFYDEADWVIARKSPLRGWNPVTGCGERAPFEPASVQAWAPKKSSSLRLRWYEHVDVPAEVWTETDQLVEGMYVAFGDDGVPLVVGVYVRGERHGPWYYSGWREDEGARRATIVRIEKWVMGRLDAAWEAGPDEVALDTEGRFFGE